MEVNDEKKTETQRTTDYVCRRVLLQTLDATPEITVANLWLNKLLSGDGA